MKLPSTRIRKRRAPSRLQSDSHQNTPVPRRRSYRLQSSQRSASIPHTLGSYYESQSPLEQRPADPQASQPIGATSNTRVPTPCPIEASIPVALRVQFQEYLCPSQTCEPVQQPKPLPPKRPYASFLEDSVYHLPWSPAPKRFRPDSAVTQWIESISGSESYRESHCRSDTLGYLDGELTPGRLTKSALNMEYALDTDGFAVPSIPASFYTSSVVPSNTTGSSRKKLVEDPYYRVHNLAENNIYMRMRSSCEQYPERIASLVDEVRMDRNAPGPSPDDIMQDMGLENLEMGLGESDVEDYFRDKIFAKPAPQDSLRRIDKIPMARQVVPDVKSQLKVSTPAPDMLYGYNRLGAFTYEQQAQFRSIRNEIIASSQDVMYPFFVIECKSDIPGAPGSLYEATNQCLGGSATCVNITERLNRQLRQCKSNEVQPINNAVFSIAMNGTEARLYISWKHNERDYYMRKVRSFALQEPDHFLEFRKYVRNIIDWGKDKRLKEIRKSLDSLIEENRKTASQLARSRPQPLDDRASSSHSRGGRRRNSRANSVQEHPSSRANYPPSASSQENYQYESFVQTRAANRVYVSPYPSPQENNQDDSSLHVPAADIVYAPHDTLTFLPITPPQSTEDTSLPPVSSEDIDDSHVRGHKRTRSRSQEDSLQVAKASQETLG